MVDSVSDDAVSDFSGGQVLAHMYQCMGEAYGLFSEVNGLLDIRLEGVNEGVQMVDRSRRRVVYRHICGEA